MRRQTTKRFSTSMRTIGVAGWCLRLDFTRTSMTSPTILEMRSRLSVSVHPRTRLHPEYGAVPVIIEVFREIDYSGQHSVIMRDISSVFDIGMNDMISSIRIQRGSEFSV